MLSWLALFRLRSASSSVINPDAIGALGRCGAGAGAAAGGGDGAGAAAGGL